MKYSIGNHKLGKDTLIFNMGSATHCPSKQLGLCQLPNQNKCYALKSERIYPQVLPYRKAQARYWKRNRPETIARDIRTALKKHKAVKYIRVNEAGDLYGALDAVKLCAISAWVPGVTFYAYTARRDLVPLLRRLQPKNLIINGSGFMADNNFAYELPRAQADHVCPGDCRVCDFCKKAGIKKIRVNAH